MVILYMINSAMLLWFHPKVELNVYFEYNGQISISDLHLISNNIICFRHIITWYITNACDLMDGAFLCDCYWWLGNNINFLHVSFLRLYNRRQGINRLVCADRNFIDFGNVNQTSQEEDNLNQPTSYLSLTLFASCHVIAKV